MNISIPRWALITIGLLPIASIFVLLVWGVVRNDPNPTGIAVFDQSGEAQVNRKQATDFTLKLFDGTNFALSSLNGKIIMIDFWASWCPPCRAEAPALEHVWRQYRHRDVVFVGIAIWDEQNRAKTFLSDVGTTYIVGLDPQGEIGVTYGVTGIPEKYFIGRDGRVIRKFVGPMNESRLKTILDELLEEP
ncbi:TlpA family protein disulfide reductase [Dehalococcoidia bacterium]|nr:TlpA family protein disulfide reductase [Dehalococcoidia bacterium]